MKYGKAVVSAKGVGRELQSDGASGPLAVALLAKASDDVDNIHPNWD